VGSPRKPARALAWCALAVSLAAPTLAPAQTGEVPGFGSELPAGVLTTTERPRTPADTARPRTADRSIRDWIGRRTGYAGATTYSRGELVHEDHIWDGFGASDPARESSTRLLDAIVAQDPNLYRPQSAFAIAGFGAYGGGPMDLVADITEVRVAAQRDRVTLLARTVIMTATEQPAVLVLVDSAPGDSERSVPFNSGITTTRADVALLLTGRGGTAVDLATGARETFTTTATPRGYTNAVEAEIPRALIGDPGRRAHLRIAVAAGRLDPAAGELAARTNGPAIANVAFRRDEPVRPKFDKRQAQVLTAGTIDPFFADVDLGRLAAGVNQRVAAGPGYHDRVMTTDKAISKEQGAGDSDGILQRYGMYVPAGLDLERPVASTVFLHGSSMDAHDFAVLTPGLMRSLGDARRSVIIMPKARTGFSFFVGAGLEDVNAATADAARVLRLDRRRSTLGGYSMGGYGAFLLAALYPDRFSATFSIEGLVGGDVVSPGRPPPYPADVRRVFPNLRWVPTLIYQGGADANVPVTNATAAMDTLGALGYRSRLLLFPADNHFSPGLVDHWDPAVEYLDRSPTIDLNPPRVTLVRDMTVERGVNEATGSSQMIFPPGGHRLRFDRAYWVSGLEPADPQGTATIDARSRAIPLTPHEVTAESGSGAFPNPYVMSGRAWTETGSPEALANRFTAELKGVRAVRLNARRMRLKRSRPIRATVTTDHATELRLTGRWPRPAPSVTLNGARLRVAATRRALTLELPVGRAVLRIRPRPAAS